MRRLIDKIFKRKSGGTFAGNRLAQFVHANTMGLFGNGDRLGGKSKNLFNF